MNQLLSGNEAVARGAWEAGVEVAAGYPGTPSTEILESIAAYDGVYAEWSVNEKVAFEVACGAAFGGRRSLAAMKHVGVNVAADALMTAAYTGVNRGLVLVSADDPGIHSSQNEQDNRLFAAFAKIPMLEPADSAEAHEFTRLAFEISERFDTPVLLRLTTRICHGRGVVAPGNRGKVEPYPYRKNAQKYVMVPTHARVRHQAVEERRLALERYAEDCRANRLEMGDTAVGVVAAGVAYQYAKEVLPGASFFKPGLTWPLPEKALKEFAERVEKLYVVEELEPFLEDRLRVMGLTVTGKELLPRTGELSPELLREKFFPEKSRPRKTPPVELPDRPPVMCPGCPHRRVFYLLKKMRATVTGDIGCYTLSALEPLSTMDTCICMGASIGLAQGFRKALGEDDKKPSVAVLGDSTFIHAGIPALINAVYNQTNITVIVLDNRTTAMTGLQEHPGTGRTLQGGEAPEFDFEALARAVGVGAVATVDPADLVRTEEAIRGALDHPGPALVVARRACVLVERDQYRGVCRVEEELCSLCNLCLRLGCPAISRSGETVVIDPTLCEGCSLCVAVCPTDAIVSAAENAPGK